MSAPDLLVIGGGIAGLTTALAAAELGLSVTVVHTGRPGEASRAAAGMLAPSVEGMPAAVLSHALAARDLYPEFLAGLYERTGRHVALDRNGILEVASSDDDLAMRAARAGEGAVVLEARALQTLEPALGGHHGAVLHAGDGAVDNVALMDALELAVSREPRIALTLQHANAVTFQAGAATVRMSTGEALSAGTLLVASGAWAAQLDGLPRVVPVRPLMGQLLRLDGRHVGHVTYAGGGYLIPRGDALVVGATSEETGFEAHTSGSGRDALLGIAHRAAPSLAGAPVLAHWAGLRPVSPDALPILGRDPEVPALAYACGFSRNGILLAPWAARHLSSSVASERDPAALSLFGIDRFGSAT